MKLFGRYVETYSSSNVVERLRLSKLRGSIRVINSIPGEKVLTLGRDLKFLTDYNFGVVARGVDRDVLHPFLSLKAHTDSDVPDDGKPTQINLHYDALLALGRGTVSGIRQREADALPGAVPVTSLTLGQQLVAKKVQNRP